MYCMLRIGCLRNRFAARAKTIGITATMYSSCTRVCDRFYLLSHKINHLINKFYLTLTKTYSYDREKTLTTALYPYYHQREYLRRRFQGPILLRFILHEKWLF